MTSKLKFFILLICSAYHLIGNSQITFEKKQDELIDLGKSGNIDAFIREISKDSLFVLWKVKEEVITSYRTKVSQYHIIEFKATYKDLENLALWIENSKKSKTEGTIMIGEWKLSYFKSKLVEPNFKFSSKDGYFELNIEKKTCERFMERKNLKKAINKFNQRKRWEEKRKSKEKN